MSAQAGEAPTTYSVVSCLVVGGIKANKKAHPRLRWAGGLIGSRVHNMNLSQIVYTNCQGYAISTLLIISSADSLRAACAQLFVNHRYKLQQQTSYQLQLSNGHRTLILVKPGRVPPTAGAGMGARARILARAHAMLKHTARSIFKLYTRFTIRKRRPSVSIFLFAFATCARRSASPSCAMRQIGRAHV